MGETGHRKREISFRDKGFGSWNGLLKVVLIFHGTISKTLEYISVSWFPSPTHRFWDLRGPQGPGHPPCAHGKKRLVGFAVLFIARSTTGIPSTQGPDMHVSRTVNPKSYPLTWEKTRISDYEGKLWKGDGR